MLEHPEHELTHVLQSIGLDTNNFKNKLMDKSLLQQGVHVLLDYHLKGYLSEERADIMGELLFNGGLFPHKSSSHVDVKVTRSVTSNIFWQLLCCAPLI